MKTKSINTSHCQVETVKYNDRDYKVQSDKNGFRFIKVSESGRRVIISVKKLEQDDIVFDYVFNGKFQEKNNKYLDMCVLLRSSNEPEITFNKNKDRLMITEIWSDFKTKVSQLNKNFKNHLIFIKNE